MAEPLNALDAAGWEVVDLTSAAAASRGVIRSMFMP